MTKEDLTARLKRGILVLDGAMGTMIMRQNLDEDKFRGGRFKDHPVALKGCNDVLVLTQPDLIRNIHAAYLEAGSDIITTNTFNANGISLGDYQLLGYVKEINRKGAELARLSVDAYCRNRGISEGERPLVAGSIGPTSVSLSTGSDKWDFDAMAKSFAGQAVGLIEGGADILLLETVYDLRNSEAAIVGIKRAFEEKGESVPLIISATLTHENKLYSGEAIEEFVDAMSASGAVALGLNCGNGAEEMVWQIERLRSLYSGYIFMSPNAGLPDSSGNYAQTPEIILQIVRPLLENGIVNIIGGCCGTTPEHIRLIAQAVKDTNS